MAFLRSSALVSSLVVLGALLSAPDARACGGTFCDVALPGTPPKPPMPVDQTGENILFVLDGQNVEAHVQIQYTGNPSRFAWIVPMPAAPDVSVGSEILFENLLAGTVPTFAQTTSVDQCPGASSSQNDAFACGSSSSTADESAPPGAADFTGGNGAGGGSGVQVVQRKVVGSFLVQVIAAQSVDELTTWLSDNGYEVNQAAPPILQAYIDQAYVFVAVKLEPGEGVDQIHPLVFRYPGTEPCVPLRLTAIAAKDDMAVRAFFLGRSRVVPKSYKHVVVDPAAFDWTTQGKAYDAAVSAAVDDPVARGQAFVTDYAGPSSVVSRSGIWQGSWRADAFETLSPVDAIGRLKTIGLLACTASTGCTSPHPLVMGLLEKWLPPPPGVSANAFYTSPSTYASQIDVSKWDAKGFAADFDDRVAKPAEHAYDALGTWPYVTRLFTTISPVEMTADPTFVARADLPDVSPARSATLRQSCGGKTGEELPDGRSVALDSPAAWPTIPNLPAAERVEEYDDETSPPKVLADRGAAIDAALESWNDAHGWPPGTQFGVQGGHRANACGCSVPKPATSEGFFGLAALAMLLRRRRRGTARDGAGRRVPPRDD